MLFFWSFYSLKNPENNVSWFQPKYWVAQLNIIIIIINNNNNKNKYVSWAPNQYIRMISEGVWYQRLE